MPPGLYNSLKLYSLRSRTTVTHAVEDFCCLLFVFPTSALLKREENEALGTAAQLRWTAARTELHKNQGHPTHRQDWQASRLPRV